jgi:hypothetical protein
MEIDALIVGQKETRRRCNLPAKGDNPLHAARFAVRICGFVDL